MALVLYWSRLATSPRTEEQHTSSEVIIVVLSKGDRRQLSTAGADAEGQQDTARTGVHVDEQKI